MIKANLDLQFSEIINNNQGILYKIANTYCENSEDRKDLIQEISIQIWKSLDRYNNESKLSTWIYRIALNVSISHYRKKKNQEQKSTMDNSIHQSWINVDARNEYPSEDVERLHGFINQLNELDKALILLYLDEKSHGEMSEILGISETNVATKISRIKKKLKQRFTIN